MELSKTAKVMSKRLRSHHVQAFIGPKWNTLDINKDNKCNGLKSPKYI